MARLFQRRPRARRTDDYNEDLAQFRFAPWGFLYLGLMLIISSIGFFTLGKDYLDLEGGRYLIDGGLWSDPAFVDR